MSKLSGHRILMTGATIVALMIAIALLGPLLYPASPLQMNPGERLSAPSSKFPMGTDHLGRDVLARVMAGGRLSLLVGISVVVIAGVIGTAVGLVAGASYRLDNILMRILDGMMAFPALLLALALMAAWRPSVFNLVLALSIVFMPRAARIVRGSVLAIRETDYVTAGIAIGSSHARLLVMQVLPGCIPPLIIQLTYTFAIAVLSEASLSFLGVGLPPYVPTWGTVISDGQAHMYSGPWISLFPGIAITLTVLGLNLLGDGLRDYFDPSIRTQAR